ncbi:hypothetical protein C8F01DRAFT_420297 [Mycena amicta]|nr:hypothetical protein C8F01DRAFT_420297 [Mycena amicta]
MHSSESPADSPLAVGNDSMVCRGGCENAGLSMGEGSEAGGGSENKETRESPSLQMTIPLPYFACATLTPFTYDAIHGSARSHISLIVPHLQFRVSFCVSSPAHRQHRKTIQAHLEVHLQPPTFDLDAPRPLSPAHTIANQLFCARREPSARTRRSVEPRSSAGRMECLVGVLRWYSFTSGVWPMQRSVSYHFSFSCPTYGIRLASGSCSAAFPTLIPSRVWLMQRSISYISSALRIGLHSRVCLHSVIASAIQCITHLLSSHLSPRICLCFLVAFATQHIIRSFLFTGSYG